MRKLAILHMQKQGADQLRETRQLVSAFDFAESEISRF